MKNIPITIANTTGTDTTDMTFNIDLSAQRNLPAGTYTGTLNIRADAN